MPNTTAGSDACSTVARSGLVVLKQEVSKARCKELLRDAKAKSYPPSSALFQQRTADEEPTRFHACAPQAESDLSTVSAAAGHSRDFAHSRDLDAAAFGGACGGLTLARTKQVINQGTQ